MLAEIAVCGATGEISFYFLPQLQNRKYGRIPSTVVIRIGVTIGKFPLYTCPIDRKQWEISPTSIGKKI